MLQPCQGPGISPGTRRCLSACWVLAVNAECLEPAGVSDWGSEAGALEPSLCHCLCCSSGEREGAALEPAAHPPSPAAPAAVWRPFGVSWGGTVSPASFGSTGTCCPPSPAWCCRGLEALWCVLGGHCLLPALAGIGPALLSCSRARQGEIRQSIPPQGMRCGCLLAGEGQGGGEQPIPAPGTALGCSISPLQGQGQPSSPEGRISGGCCVLRVLGWQSTAVGTSFSHPLHLPRAAQSAPAPSCDCFAAGFNPPQPLAALLSLWGSAACCESREGASPRAGGGSWGPRWALGRC